MPLNHQDALNKYKNTQVSTADGAKLVVMLYEGALRSIEIAIKKMDYKNYDLVNDQIKKSIDVIDELIASLDMEAGVISERLKSIYLYMINKLNESNINKSTKELEEVKSLLEELLSAWKSIVAGEPSTDGKPSKNKKNPPYPLTGGISISG